jgi:hypothetical protein
MADEITLTGRLQLVNGNLKVTRDLGSRSADQTTARYVANVQDVGFAAHEALDMGEVSTAGWAVFYNHDSTNYVEIGIDDTGTFEAVIKLEAGEAAGPLRLASSAPYAQANTAAVDLEYVILED